MNQAEPTKKPTRSIGLWLVMLALMFISVPLLLFALIAVYFSSRSAHIEMRDRALVDQRMAAELQARQATTVAQNLTPPIVPPGAAEQVDSSIAQVRVDFPDFGSRTADALIIDETNGLILLTAPASIFAPITGKMNGRMMTRQPGLIALTDGSIPMSSSSFGSMMPAGGPGMMADGVMPGMSGMPGGLSAYSSEVAIAAQFPGLGLTLLRTHTRPAPLRIKGDFAVAAVGEALSVHQKSMASLPATLTVLATDQAVTDAAGQRLDHLLKLTVLQDGLGGIVCNSKGQPIGQIVLTVTDDSGGSFTYAAPLGRIFDEYYSQATDSAEGPQTRPGAGLDVVRSKMAPRVVEEPLPPLGPDVEITDPFGQPPPERSTGSQPPPPIQAGPLTNPGPDDAPVDALLPSSEGTASVLRIYKVKSSSANAVDKLRPLFSNTLQVAADTAHGTVLVLGDRATHEKVAAALKSIDELALRQSKDRELPDERLTLDKSPGSVKLAPSETPAQSADSVPGMTTDLKPGKNTLRGQSPKLAGPDPQEIAQLLTRLYGQQTTISVDDASGRVLVTINPAVSSDEAQQVLLDIKSTAADLEIPATSSQRTVTIYGTGSQGLTGMIMLDPSQQQTPPPTRIDDQSMDHQARQLAQRYLSANPANQPALRKELADLTERHFNLRQAERQREIDEIGRRLEKLRASQQQRQQRKSEVIERRIQDLLDTNSDFWTGESRRSKKSPATGQAVLGAGDRPMPATASLSNPNQASENPPAVRDPSTVPGATAVAEKTYDNVPYGQWLKLLQTERKPDLIAAAIGASSRLAEPQDQARITHQIFIAALSIEFGNESERLLVWETSWKALGRLRPELVAAELLSVVHNPETTQSGHQFVGECLANHLTKPLQEELLKQAPKLIDEFLTLHQRGGKDVDWLLAGASALWRESGRPISDFGELQSQMLKFIENGFAMEVSGPVETLRPEWLIVAGALIARNPEAPNLAVKLYDHAQQSREILALIGELGRHAEPVVPLLVDDFVANWNVYERESRLAEPSGPLTRTTTAPSQRCRDLIAVLGKIGVGEKGGLLLRDLRLILPASRTRFESPEQIRVASLAATVAAAVPQWTLPSNDALPLILNDHTMITGRWRLSDGLPSPSNVLLRFDQSTVQVSSLDGSGLFLAEGGQKLGDRFEINPSAAVKQISFFEVTGPRGSAQKELSGTRRDGIYELTGTKLRLQLGGLEQPRPTAFARDRAELAEGGLLLEFQREIPDWTKSTQIPR